MLEAKKNGVFANISFCHSSIYPLIKADIARVRNGCEGWGAFLFTTDHEAPCNQSQNIECTNVLSRNSLTSFTAVRNVENPST